MSEWTKWLVLWLLCVAVWAVALAFADVYIGWLVLCAMWYCCGRMHGAPKPENAL